MSSLSAPVSALGLWRTTALVVGNIIGTGILMLPASLAAFGTFGLIGWMLTSAGSICLALIFARLSKQFPKTGGPYVYTREAFGEFVGFQMAWSYWIGCWAGNAALAVAFVGYLTPFFPALEQQSHLQFMIAASSVWLFTILNVVSLRSAGAAQMVFVVLKVLPLFLIGAFGIFYIDINNYFPLNPSGASWFQVMSATCALTLFAFMGLESATIPAENVRDPERTIPRATIIGTIFSAIIYIWTTVVLLGVLSAPKLAESEAPFASAAQIIFGSTAASLIALCAAISAFGTLNGWILLQGQIPLAASRDGLFPAAFGRLSRFSTPAFGIGASSVLMTGVLYLNYGEGLVAQFTSIVTLTTFSLLMPYLYCAAAELKLLLSTNQPLATRRGIRAVAVALLAFTYALIATFGAGQQAVQLGILLVFLGFPVYAFMKRSPSRREATFTENFSAEMVQSPFNASSPEES